MGKLAAGMQVRIVGTGDVGALVLVREAAQTCVVKLASDGSLRKNVPLDDVQEAPRSPLRAPLALPPSTTTQAASPRKSRLSVGDKVRARFQNGAKWFDGTVAKVRADGTYDVEYDDGDVETRVDASYIQRGEAAPPRALASPKKSVPKPRAQVGDKVKARYKRGAKLYSGVLTRVHADDTFDVKYEDGNVETRVDAKYIEFTDKAKAELDDDDDAERARVKRFQVGDAVNAKYKGGKKLYPGTIKRVHSDGTYDIKYEAGDVETDVQADLVEEADVAKPKSPTKERSPAPFSVGDAVKARYKGGAKLFPGTIQRARTDGTYDIKYDDGDVEANVDPRHIERIEKEPAKAPRGQPLAVGDRVKARYKKGAKFFPGEITKCHSDGSYDIRYEDGDAETRVARDLIEAEPKASSPSKASSKKEASLRVGDAVRARYKKGSKLYPGKIARVRTDGTFDVEYEDGDIELRVDASHIETVRSEDAKAPQSPTKKKSFEVGDAVMARFKKGAKLFRGTIKRARTDGTYDIKYEDGDVETSVEVEYIQADENAQSHGDSTFTVGQPIQAKYKNSSKWYPGRISHVRTDGSYDVEYDDGERETKVDAFRIEATPAKSSPTRNETALHVGDRVKARFKGGKKLYEAVVTRARTDGTYDLKFEDGDVETHVAREMIERGVDGSKDNSHRAKHHEPEVGDTVKAYYKKGKKLYPGKIVRRHSDDTYDINYDDGEVENRVARGLIVCEPTKPSDGPSASPRKPRRPLRVGDRVAATHKRSKKPVRGRISRVRSDETVDIDFDDGETATRVEVDIVEALTSSDGDDGPRKKKPSEQYEVGDHVKARYKKGAKWFPGTITRARPDGSCDIKYDDGDVEPSVALDCIEPVESKSSNAKFEVGDNVSARYKNGSKWYDGTVKKVRTDGTFDIRFEDGDSEEHVQPEHIRSRGETSTDRDDGSSKKKFSKGDVVEADYKGKGKYRQGRIARVHDDGSVDVEYDDGNLEKRVSTRSVWPVKDEEKERKPRSRKPGSDSGSENQTPRQGRRQSASSSSSESPRARKKKKKLFAKGARVALRKAVDAKSRRIGRVKKAHSDGSCDVEYKDGDVSKRVSSDALLLCSDSGSSEGETTNAKALRHRFKRGQKVLACWRRPTRMAKAAIADRWDEATILSTDDNGTYSIRYRDGAMEEDVPDEAIKSVQEVARTRPPNESERELSEVDLVFLLEQLAMTLYEEGEIQKKPSVRFGGADASGSSSGSSEGSDSNGSSPKKKRMRKRNPVEKAIERLFDAKSLKAYRDRFDDHDTQDAGRISRSKIIDLVEALCAKTNLASVQDNSIRRQLNEWFSTQDVLRTHSKFDFTTFMVAFAVAKNVLSKQKIQQTMANALEARFASHHESKKQLEMWQQKLGFRTFETLQRCFHDSSIPRMYPAQIRVSEVTPLFDQVTRSSVPSKPLEVYLKQMQLLPHHTLHLPEFMCCYYQLYGSADSTRAPGVAEQLELRPVAFVASCLFSNGDPSCERHGDLVRRLCIGRTPAQVELIMRFREVFESLQASEGDHSDTTISSSQLHTFASKVVGDPSVLEPSILALRKRTAAVSLVELFSTCGFVVDELTAAPTVANAIDKLRLRTDATEVRRIISLVRSMCLKVLRFPNNPDYWRIRSDSAAFQQKLGRFHGATSLIEAVGFAEHGKTYFELRGARTADGKRSSCLSKPALDALRERCAELDAELAVMDGVESVVAILQRVAKHREHDSPLTLQECEEILRNLASYIETVLKNPKDSRSWRIRESNKLFQRQIGYLSFAADLMASVGYDLTLSSQGNVYMLRGTGLARASSGTSDAVVNASLSNFAFSSLSEHMEWFLWRRKQEIESLLQDDMEYLVQMLPPVTSSGPTHTQQARTSIAAASVRSLGKMYPYGRNVIDVFSKTATQKLQLAMVQTLFESLDSKKLGYLTEENVVQDRKLAKRWASMDAFDLDKDGRVDFADFVGSFGPILDHTFDLAEVADLVPFQKMTLSEQVSTVVGRLRLTLSFAQVSSILDTVIGLLSRAMDQPDNSEVRDISTSSQLATQSARIPAVKMLLELCGYKASPPPDSKMHATSVAFTLHPHQQVRFQSVSKPVEPSISPLDPQTVTRLQLICSMLGGHARAMLFPSVSDIGAVARAIAEMRPIGDWIKLLEVVLLCLDNFLKHPDDDDRYRQLNTTTKTFTTVVAKVSSGVQLFLSIGFRETDRGTLVLPDESKVPEIQARRLEMAIGCHLLKIADKLSSTAPGETEYPSPTRVASERTLKGDAAVDYYKKKALAADLARDEALRKSANLEKQLGIVARSQSRRAAPTTPKSRPRSTGHQRPRSPTGNTRFSASIEQSFRSESDIEAEILAAFSPRKHSLEVGRTRTTANEAARKPPNRSHPSSAHASRHPKSAQRRAPSSTIAPLVESTLAMDSNAETYAVVLGSTSASVQPGALVRIGAEIRDLTEERIITHVDRDTYPNLTKIVLHSPLQFPHFVRDLVFVFPAQAVDGAARIAAAGIEAFIRVELLEELLDRVLRMHADSSCSARNRPRNAEAKENPSAATVFVPVRTVTPPGSVTMAAGGRRGDQLVLWSPPGAKAPAAQVVPSLALDVATTRKLRAVWDGLVMQYGGSNHDSVLWSRLHAASRRIPWIGMCGPSAERDETSQARWSDFLEWLNFPQRSQREQGVVETPEQMLALTLLRQQFRALKTSAMDANGVFAIVPLDELLARSAACLLAIASSPTDARDFEAVHALLDALKSALHARVVTWPEVFYSVHHGLALSSVELFPIEEPLQSFQPGRHVVDIACGDASDLVAVLFLDGFVELWRPTADGSAQAIHRALALIASDSSNEQKNSVKQSFVEEYFSAISQFKRDKDREAHRRQRISCALDGFIGKTRENRSLLTFTASDTCVVVNATMLGAGFLLYHVDSVGDATMRPLRRLRIEAARRDVKPTREGACSQVVSSGGLVASFAFSSHGCVVVFQTVTNPNCVLWVADGASGRILLCIDEFAWLPNQNLLASVSTSSDLSPVVSSASSKASYVSVSQTNHDEPPADRLVCVLPAETTSKSTAFVSALLMQGQKVFAAYDDGKIALWTVSAASWQTKERRVVATLVQATQLAIRELRVLCEDYNALYRGPHHCHSTALVIPPHDAESLREWDSDTADNCVRVALYLLESGEIVEASAVEGFSHDMVRLDVVSDRDGRLRGPGFDRVVLQPEAVVRAAFVVVEYRREGVFAQKSVRELLEDVKSKCVLQQTEREREAFARGYEDSVRARIRCYYRPGDSGDCCVALPMVASSSNSENRPSMVLCGLGSSNAKPVVQFWLFSDGDAQRVSWEFEAFRFRRQRALHAHSQRCDRISREQEALLGAVKTLLTGLYEDSSDRTKMHAAESLLPCVERLCLLAMLQYRQQDPVEAMVREIFQYNAATEVDARLRNAERRSVEFRPWMQRLRDATRAAQPAVLTEENAVLLVREWRREFLDVASLCCIVEKLDVVASIPETHPALEDDAMARSIIAQQFCSFALATWNRKESGEHVDDAYHKLMTFIPPRLAVESLLHSCDVASRIEKCVDVVVDRTAADLKMSVHKTLTAEQIYAQLLIRSRLCARLGAAEHRLRVIQASAEAPLEQTLPASAIQHLRRILKTPLPDGSPQVSSLTLCVPLSMRCVGSRLTATAQARTPTAATLPVSLVLHDTSDAASLRQLQLECKFYRRVQQRKVRELFLPVLLDASDLPILRSEVLPLDAAQTLVCESLVGWRTIAECVGVLLQTDHPHSLAHWQDLVAFWCRQVLLALVVLEDDGISLASLTLEDVILSPDCNEARFAGIHAAISSCEDAPSPASNVAAFGMFVLELCELLERVEASEPFGEDAFVVLKHRRSRLMEIWSQYDDTVETKEVKELMDRLHTHGSSLTRVLAAALLAFQPPGLSFYPPTTSVLWCAVLSDMDDEPPEIQSSELAWVVNVKPQVDSQILDPLRYIESNVADVLTATGVFQNALAQFNDLVAKICGLWESPASWAQRVLDTLLMVLIPPGMMQRLARISVSLLDQCLRAAQRAPANAVVHKTLETLLLTLDQIESCFTCPGSSQLASTLCDTVQALSSMCGAPSNPSSLPTTRFRPSSIVAAALWRMGESSLREVIGSPGGDPTDRFPRIESLVRSIKPTFAASIPIDMDPTTAKAAPVVALWWRQRDEASVDDRSLRRHSAHTLDGLPCYSLDLSLDVWTAVHQTLELRFNASTAATSAAPKFRLAAMQTWLAPAFLDRKSCFPLVFAHDAAALAWLRLDMAATLGELLRDPDDRIVFGTASILEAYTRVLRCDPFVHGKQPALVERHAFRETSPALQLALAITSNGHLTNQVTTILTRLVRTLKALGESATSAAVSSRYGASSLRSPGPVALLCVLMSLLVNCLYGGDVCTRHWVSSGLCSLLAAHAKASSLSFLKIVDASWMNQSHASSLSRPASEPQWAVFSARPVALSVRKTSPFELLLREMAIHTASRNVQILQYQTAHSTSFRQLMEKIDGSASPASLWIASSGFGTLEHVWEVVQDIDECDGTLDEQAQAIEYATSVVRRALLIRSSTLPMTIEKVCRAVWSWMEASWRALVAADRLCDNAERHGAVATAALRFVHVISTCESLAVAELHLLLSLDDSDEQPPPTVFRRVLSLLVGSAPTEQPSSVLSSVVRSAMELTIALAGGQREERARLLLKTELSVASVLRLLRVDSEALARCCGGSNTLRYALRAKTRLWAALLERGDRDVARAIVDDEFLGHLVSNCIDCDFSLQQDDRAALAEASGVVNARLEALAMLETLLLSCSANSLASHLLTSDFLKSVLIQRTIQTEKQRVLSYGHYHRTHRSRVVSLASFAIRMVATAKRFVQLVCCLSVDHSTDHVDSAVAAALARVGVPDAVVEWHLRAAPSPTQSRRVEEFWEAWPEASAEPRSSHGNDRDAVVVTGKPARARAAPVRQAKDLVVPASSTQAKPQASVQGTKQQLTPLAVRPVSAEPKAIPLDELLVCLGHEVTVLETIFQRHAACARHGERVMAPARVALALRDARARSDAASASSPLTFSQFLLLYARRSGLEELWRATADASAVEFVWLASGGWTSVAATHVAAVRSAVGGSTVSGKQLAETVLALHGGVLARPEIERILDQELQRQPTKLHARADGETLTLAEVRRVAAVALHEASRRPAAARLLLQTTRSPRRPAMVAVSPVRVEREEARESVVQTLVSIDVESARALGREEEREKRRSKRGGGGEDRGAAEKIPSDVDSDLYSVFSGSSAEERELEERWRSAAREKKKKKGRAEEKRRSSSSGEDEKKPEERKKDSEHSSSSSSDIRERRRGRRRRRRPPSHVTTSSDSSPLRPQTSDPVRRASRPQPTDAVRPEDVMLRRVFAKYDRDGDGAISFADLRRVVGPKASGVELQRWIAEKDRRGVGVVSFADFVHAFAATTARPDVEAVAAPPVRGSPRMGTRRVSARRPSGPRGYRLGTAAAGQDVEEEKAPASSVTQ